MPQQHTTLDQVNFLGQWFISWSEMQREDFLPILVQAYQPKDHINGLLGGIDSISLQGRRPSLFDCQVKLFHDWFVSWTEGERERLLQHLREVDPDFMAQFDKQISGIESPQEEAAIQSECTEESLNNPSSSVSSPPSTLPRSHSPHDSGLDEPPSDGDHTGPHSLDSSHDTDDVAAAVVVGGNVSTGDITELPLAKTAVPHIPNNNEVEEDKSAKVEPQENGTPDEKIVPASEGMENSLPAED
ncbi:hypothetical protein Pmani_009512 [Petrolisthes manimaculis]|uniref:Uncharacterized protein n=1 Tax=Petrolisthes manimaculis TaxID=1843537 RepID=A0AAE1Q6V0_9EUCA|nr:hypothetical protein Pmani_009512 [Petrolisthes manimaculis]